MEKKKNILIIDDHDSMRFILGGLLSKQYNVWAKKDGLEAFSFMSSGNIPDLIMLDMSMPRLSGYDFLMNLRSSGFFKEIPVMIVSGHDDTESMENCKKLGVKNYILKPFNPDTLREKINHIFQSQKLTA